jgi:hypothetical protein
VVTLPDVRAAADRIRAFVVRTPLEQSLGLSLDGPVVVVLTGRNVAASVLQQYVLA